MKKFSWAWWNEKTILVPEHYHDWMAPRWYGYILIPFVYTIMLSIVIFMLTFSYNHRQSNQVKQIEAAIEVNSGR